jgi:hypothetical protein
VPQISIDGTMNPPNRKICFLGDLIEVQNAVFSNNFGPSMEEYTYVDPTLQAWLTDPRVCQPLVQTSGAHLIGTIIIACCTYERAQLLQIERLLQGDRESRCAE